jgi:hypothetical protein
MCVGQLAAARPLRRTPNARPLRVPRRDPCPCLHSDAWGTCTPPSHEPVASDHCRARLAASPAQGVVAARAAWAAAALTAARAAQAVASDRVHLRFHRLPIGPSAHAGLDGSGRRVGIEGGLEGTDDACRCEDLLDARCETLEASLLGVEPADVSRVFGGTGVSGVGVRL